MFVNNVTILNVSGDSFDLNTASSVAPLNDFDVTVPDRSDATRYKPMQDGAWPTRSYNGGMSIHMEGALFADTSTNYVALRKQLLAALRGQAGVPVTAYRRGRVSFQPAGETEYWYADFGPVEFSSPVRGNFPALTEFLITLQSFEAWFIGASSGDKHWWS